VSFPGENTNSKRRRDDWNYTSGWKKKEVLKTVGKTPYHRGTIGDETLHPRGDVKLNGITKTREVFRWRSRGREEFKKKNRSNLGSLSIKGGPLVIKKKNASHPCNTGDREG